MNYYILTLQSVHSTMKCERRLKSEEIAVEIIPTPAIEVGDCGISLKVSEDDIVRTLNVMVDCGKIKKSYIEENGMLSLVDDLSNKPLKG